MADEHHSLQRRAGEKRGAGDGRRRHRAAAVHGHGRRLGGPGGRAPEGREGHFARGTERGRLCHLSPDEPMARADARRDGLLVLPERELAEDGRGAERARVDRISAWNGEVGRAEELRPGGDHV